jgi:hypothetical protein
MNRTIAAKRPEHRSKENAQPEVPPVEDWHVEMMDPGSRISQLAAAPKVPWDVARVESSGMIFLKAVADRVNEHQAIAEEHKKKTTVSLPAAARLAPVERRSHRSTWVLVAAGLVTAAGVGVIATKLLPGSKDAPSSGAHHAALTPSAAADSSPAIRSGGHPTLRLAGASGLASQPRPPQRGPSTAPPQGPSPSPAVAPVAGSAAEDRHEHGASSSRSHDLRRRARRTTRHRGDHRRHEAAGDRADPDTNPDTRDKAGDEDTNPRVSAMPSVHDALLKARGSDTKATTAPAKATAEAAKRRGAGDADKAASSASIDEKLRLLRETTRAGNKAKAGKSSAKALPRRLDAKTLRRHGRALQSRGRACLRRFGIAYDVLPVHVRIHGATGRVKSARVGGRHAGSPTARCIERAARQLTFPRFQRPTQGCTIPVTDR